MIPTQQLGQFGRTMRSASGYSAAVLADSPLIYLKLDETSGTSYADSSGNGRTGTGNSTITQNQAGLFGGSLKSVLFTTANAAWIDFASDPYGAGYGGNLTFECFFNVTNLTQENSLAGRGMGGAPADYSLYARTNTNGSIQCGIVTMSAPGAAQWNCTSAVSTVVAGTSYHFAMVFTVGTGLEMFLNNVSVGTTAFTRWVLRDGAVGLQVGRMITPLYCSGKIDEVAWYNTALSTTRIAAHYAARNT